MIFFRSVCYFKQLTLHPGDQVLVANHDSIDPEDEDNADVGKILFLYKNDEWDYKKDRHRAIIQWFSRKEVIVKDRHVWLHEQTLEDCEVVQESRYEMDISVETIFERCKIEMRNFYEIGPVTQRRCNEVRGFFCRFKLNRLSGSRCEIEPIFPCTGFKKVVKTPKKGGKTPTKSTKTPQKTEEVWIVNKLSPVKEVKDSLKIVLKRAVSTDNLISTPTKPIMNRRKSILKTPNSKLEGTPSKRVSMSAKLETHHEFYDDEGEENVTPPKRSRRNNDETTPKRGRSASATKKTPSKASKSLMTQFSIGQRATPVKTDMDQMHTARERLHVSAVPQSLPCREKEFREIYNFLEDKLVDNCGGCMYISGVPGTGKTATTTQAIKSLQSAAKSDEVAEFDFIDINGMRLTEPRQAYVHIYRQISGKTVSWEHAYQLLDTRFNTHSPRRKLTIMLVDELDILCNKRQDVVYNILNWPTISSAKLVVITIANTMDLPERLLMGRITSRLGLTRLTFQPYNFQQLQEIILARIHGTETFNKDAVQLVARKVAAVSGDARRALDICRRATEIAESAKTTKDDLYVVSIANVQQALAEMIASPKMQFIKSCTKYEKLWLQAVCAEISRTGIDEVIFDKVYTQMETITAFMGILCPTVGQAIGICTRLGASRILICEHGRKDLYMKILLNISADDVHYALNERES